MNGTCTPKSLLFGGTPIGPSQMKVVTSVCFHMPQLSSPTTYSYVLRNLAQITKENGYQRVETSHFLIS